MTYDPARAYACARCGWPLWPTTPIEAVIAHYQAEHPDAAEVEFTTRSERMPTPLARGVASP